ncbi:hypothetical protein OG985_47625 [Streptomyces sp. NBC_00289]
MHQIHPDGGQPGPVLHRGGPVRSEGPGLRPAGAPTESSRCSVTRGRISSGRSKTWRRSTETTGASSRPAPQPVQGPGR